MRPGVLAAGDTAAILAFVLAGLASHDEAATVVSVGRNAGPILACWFAAAAPLGTYRRPRLRALAATWVLGVGGGVLLRAALLGRPTGRGLAVFLLVSLGTTAALVGAWRLVALGLARLRRKSGDRV